MVRRVLGVIVCSLVLAAVATAEDKVSFRNRKTGAKEEVKGVIESETILGIKILPLASGTSAQFVAGGDILEVEYSPPTGSGLTTADMRAPAYNEADIAKQKTAEERAKKVEETIKAYRDLIGNAKLTDAPKAYTESRLALFLVRLAESDPARGDEARKALESFKDKYRESWEYSGVTQVLARMQESQGKVEEARKTLEELAGRAELPAEVRAQANFALVRMLLRADQVAPAEARTKELDKIIKDGPDMVRLQIYKIELQVKKGQPGEAEKQLKGILAGSVDDVKPQAANALGDFYLASKRPEDALWQYLWVDVLYNKDADEHARALFHLAKLFKDVKNDNALAEKAREKLRDAQFAGSEYQRMAAAQEKGSK